MNYPTILHPSSTFQFMNPDGQLIEIPLANPQFEAWTEKFLGDTYGGKPILDYKGEPLFPELVIIRHLEADGWKGAWVDTYRKRYLVNLDVEVHIPEEKLELLNSIYSVVGSRSGCFDVFAWRGDQVIFAESKWSKKDNIRDTQINWLLAALSLGIKNESFLMVEWDIGMKDSA